MLCKCIQSLLHVFFRWSYAKQHRPMTSWAMGDTRMDLGFCVSTEAFWAFGNYRTQQPHRGANSSWRVSGNRTTQQLVPTAGPCIKKWPYEIKLSTQYTFLKYLCPPKGKKNNSKKGHFCRTCRNWKNRVSCYSRFVIQSHAVCNNSIFPKL